MFLMPFDFGIEADQTQCIGFSGGRHSVEGDEGLLRVQNAV